MSRWVNREVVNFALTLESCAISRARNTRQERHALAHRALVS